CAGRLAGAHSRGAVHFRARAVLRGGLLAVAGGPEPGPGRPGRRPAADGRLGGVRPLRPAAVIRSAYLAAEGLEQPLLLELERKRVGIASWHGRLALSPDPPIEAAWALDVWSAPEEHAASSVKAAADA